MKKTYESPKCLQGDQRKSEGSMLKGLVAMLSTTTGAVIGNLMGRKIGEGNYDAIILSSIGGAGIGLGVGLGGVAAYKRKQE